jgi:hypothetical protein
MIKKTHECIMFINTLFFMFSPFLIQRYRVLYISITFYFLYLLSSLQIGIFYFSLLAPIFKVSRHLCSFIRVRILHTFYSEFPRRLIYGRSFNVCSSPYVAFLFSPQPRCTFRVTRYLIPILTYADILFSDSLE